MSNARELSQIATAIVVDTSKNVSVAEKITVTKDSSISGLTVGKGGSSNSTALGFQAGNAGTSNFGTMIGYQAGFSNTATGDGNVMVGWKAGYANTSGTITAVGQTALTANTTGAGNSAFGANSLVANTTGANNTGVGNFALYSNTTASLNTASGYQSMYTNTTGQYNTAYGANSLRTNNADANTAVGSSAMYSNTTGANNVAVGITSLYTNTTGSNNTALGYYALAFNTTASNNTAVGYQALYSNTTGVENVAIGRGALFGVTTGYENIGIGRGAGESITTGIRNTFVGDDAGYLVTGSSNTILGRYTGNQGGLDIRTATNYIVLSDGDGNPRLYINGSGLLYSPATYNNTSGGAANVAISASGEFIRSTSSLKYKKDVQNATHGLAEVLTLRPVTYKGKSEQDGNTVFGGLIAEEVDAVGLSEFVQYADDGSPDALAYGNMVSLCIKAIQELNQKLEAQALEIAQLKGN